MSSELDTSRCGRLPAPEAVDQCLVEERHLWGLWFSDYGRQSCFICGDLMSREVQRLCPGKISLYPSEGSRRT